LFNQKEKEEDSAADIGNKHTETVSRRQA